MRVLRVDSDKQVNKQWIIIHSNDLCNHKNLPNLRVNENGYPSVIPSRPASLREISTSKPN